MNKAKFVFFGSPKFAAIILEKLIEADFIPSVVVCNPDKPFGRKKIITPPKVKQLLAIWPGSIEILQPENLKIGNFKLKIENADFGIVAAYAKIIPKDIINSFKLGLIGVHPSLLPRHRGASPIQQTILDGDSEAGVSLFMINEGVDSGPILQNKQLTIYDKQNETTPELTRKLADLGGEMLIEIIPKFITGEIKPLPQDESKATFTKKFKTEDAFVDPAMLENAMSGVNLEKDNPEIILKKIRALNPEPGCWTILNGKRTKLFDAEIKDGKLILNQIQVEGKKPQLFLES